VVKVVFDNHCVVGKWDQCSASVPGYQLDLPAELGDYILESEVAGPLGAMGTSHDSVLTFSIAVNLVTEEDVRMMRGREEFSPLASSMINKAGDLISLMRDEGLFAEFLINNIPCCEVLLNPL
jgi:hypothetical protein